jgi:hypothetical protein
VADVHSGTREKCEADRDFLCEARTDIPKLVELCEVMHETLQDNVVFGEYENFDIKLTLRRCEDIINDS